MIKSLGVLMCRAKLNGYGKNKQYDVHKYMRETTKCTR